MPKQQSAQPATVGTAEYSAEAIIGSACYCQCSRIHGRINNRLSLLLPVQQNTRQNQQTVPRKQSAQPVTASAAEYKAETINSAEAIIGSACYCQCSRIHGRINNRLSLSLPIQQNIGLSRYTYTFHNASQRRGQEGKSARRGDGLRNYECFPFSQITHFQKVKTIIKKNQTTPNFPHLKK